MDDRDWELHLHLFCEEVQFFTGLFNSSPLSRIVKLLICVINLCEILDYL